MVFAKKDSKLINPKPTNTKGIVNFGLEAHESTHYFGPKQWLFRN